jgi:GGDEF domain-containing protein
MPCRRRTIDPSMRVLEVERIFLEDDTLASVVVSGDGACISRAWFFAQLSGRLGFGRSIYTRHPISFMPSPETLVLPASTTVVHAARASAGLHDGLTGLPNRYPFLERVEAARAGGGRVGAREAPVFAVLFVDVDEFKAINDVLGHEAGDQALWAVAGRLAGLESPSIAVARSGGDEFGVSTRGGPT